MFPESSDIGNVMGNVARKVGVAEAVLRLMVGLLTGLPLAFVYRSFCYKRNATIQHIFITICGVWLAFFCFGWSCLHSLVNIILAYLLLQLGGPQALTVILMFVLNVGYLITGYAFKSYSQDYSVSWTTAHCVLCLRLTVYSADSDALCNGSFSHHVEFYSRFYDMFMHKISTRGLFVNGLAWDYYDGNQDQEKLSEDFRRTAIRDCPTLLQIASYTYFFGGFLVGPQFPMKKYLLLIEGNLIDKKDDVSATRITAGLRRFSLGLIYLTMYSVLQPKVKESYLVTDEYDQKSFLYKLCYAIVTTKVFVMKYQAVWLITEGSCIISGLGYNGRSEDGRDRWDGCSNVHLLLFETAYTFQHVIDAFNLNTNQWMFRYLYKRLRFLGNKLISHFITLAFVALWHGIAPGFFLCFIGEFVIIVMEQQLLGLCRRVVQRPFSPLPLAIRIPIILFGVCVRLTGVAFFLIPFLLRRLDYTHKVWLSLYYMGPVVLLCWFSLYPTILMPMTRRFSKKPRTELTSKKLNETLKEE